MKISSQKHFAIAVLSYLTTLGLMVDLRMPMTTGDTFIQVLKALRGVPATQLITFVGIFILYSWADQYVKEQKWDLRAKVCTILPALLFAGFMVVGFSFAQINSLDLVLVNRVQKIKAFMAFIGYGIIFTVLIACFYTWLSRCRFFGPTQSDRCVKGLLGWYKEKLSTKPFQTAFLTLFVLYIPHMALSYPGLFMGDVADMVKQGFNIPETTTGYLVLVDENVRLNGHHPIVYTMLIHGYLILGKTFFGSYNVGIFLMSLTQLLGICLVVSAGIWSLRKSGLHDTILISLLAYFAFAPQMQNYMFLITKDILAACALLLFLLSLCRIMKKSPGGNGRDIVAISLCGIAMGLLRNDGKYIILGSIIFALFLVKEYRKVLFASGSAIALVLGLFFNVLMPTFHITPASRREVLSVPFQQTARYFRDYRDEVTEEEWLAVDAVLDAETIGERYAPSVPTSADVVKGTFRKTATNVELLNYFKVWFQMGLKHPGVYVQATLNNYYNYFYPGARLADMYSYGWSKMCMQAANDHAELKELGVHFSHIERLDGVRTAYVTLQESLFGIPVLSVLRSSAAYVWLLMLLVFYLIAQKAWKGLALTAPLMLSVGICCLGPCNGEYFRYLYGVSVCLPIILFQAISLCRNQNESEIENG